VSAARKIAKNAELHERALQTAIHPLLTCDDKTLAEAFERLLGEPTFPKLPLNDWEFKLAADAPGVFLRWGGFTGRQRKYLREIVKKITVER
jgi:hypothetical protein